MQVVMLFKSSARVLLGKAFDESGTHLYALELKS